jgi:hypothetical protein
VSYWEQWPSSTGHAPTFDNLGKLAELYECAVSDLLVGLLDFWHLDTTGSTQTTALMLPRVIARMPSGEIATGNSSVRLIGRLEQVRTGMRPWLHTAAVRTLDDRLAAYGLA